MCVCKQERDAAQRAPEGNFRPKSSHQKAQTFKKDKISGVHVRFHPDEPKKKELHGLNGLKMSGLGETLQSEQLEATRGKLCVVITVIV